MTQRYENTYPVALLQHHASQAMSTSSNVAGRAADEALIHDGNLQKVLGQSSGLKIIVVSLANTAQEAHGSRPAKFKLKHAEHEAFGLQDLINRITTIDHVYNFVDRWAVDLLVLRSNEDSSGANQLKLAQGDNLAREEPIDIIDTEEEGFWEETKAVVDLNQPVHQDGTHGPLNLGLHIHVMGIWLHLDLKGNAS